jgi:hypothetical protein
VNFCAIALAALATVIVNPHSGTSHGDVGTTWLILQLSARPSIGKLNFLDWLAGYTKGIVAAPCSAWTCVLVRMLWNTVRLSYSWIYSCNYSMTGYEQRDICMYLWYCRIDTWYSLHVHSSLLKVLNWNQLKVLKGTGPGSHFFEARSHQGLRAKRWERCELVTLASRFNYQLISNDIKWSLANSVSACIRFVHVSDFSVDCFVSCSLQSWRVLFRVRCRSERVEHSRTSLAVSRIPQVTLLSSLVPVLATRSAWRSLPMSLQRDKRRRQWQVTRSDTQW